MGDTKNLISTDAIEKIKKLAEAADICHFVTAHFRNPAIHTPYVYPKSR